MAPVSGVAAAAVGDVCWAQGLDDALRRVDIAAGASDTVLQRPEVDDAEAVAVDEPHERIYWAQAFGD